MFPSLVVSFDFLTHNFGSNEVILVIFLPYVGKGGKKEALCNTFVYTPKKETCKACHWQQLYMCGSI
jgi:hypothetical protein